MFRLQTIFCSVLRHHRRNLISCLLLAAVLSVVFCSLLYADFAETDAAAIRELYSRRYAVAFRDELQYNPDYPHWSEFEILLNGTSSTEGKPDIFFDEAVMAAYDHPYSVTLSLFETLGAKEYCTDYALAYADTAYVFAEEIPDWMQENLDAFFRSHGDMAVPEKLLTEHMVVGGSMEAFTGLTREYSSYLYDFILTEGREPVKDECVITDFYAAVYGKTVGDRLTLYDLYGNPVRELTISGIYTVYAVECGRRADPAIPDSGRRVTGMDMIMDFCDSPDFGTPYGRLCEDMEATQYRLDHYKGEYYCVSGAMLSLIHTDLETAYTFYGTPETDADFTDRHHINHYFAYYDLADPAYEPVFAADAAALLPDDFAEEFTVKPFAHSMTVYLRQPESLAKDAVLLLQVTLPLALLILGIVAAVLVRENGRETGIWLGLGISEGDVILRCTAENTVVMALALVLGALGGSGIHWLWMRDYPYLQISEVVYTVPETGWLFVLLMLAAEILLTAGLTALYIRIRTPIRLIRQE